MGTVYFTRHGITEWNKVHRLQGRSDIPLAVEGIAGAHLLAARVRGLGIALVVTSPLQRAAETGRIVAAACGIPHELRPALIERSFGSFEGLTRASLAVSHGLLPGQSLSTILPPDAEPLSDVAARVWAAIEALVAQPRSVLIVSHAGVFRSLWESRIPGDFRELTFGSVWRFSCENGVWTAEEYHME